MGRTQHNLSLIASAQNKMSEPMKAAAADVEKYARKLSESDTKLAKSSASLSAQRKRELSATQKVKFAMEEQAAAGDPLRLKLVSLDKAHAQLTKRLGALARAGKPLPPQMVKMAAAAKESAAAIRKEQAAADSRRKSMKAMVGQYINMRTVGTALFVGMGLWAKRQAAFGDELAKTSRKLGVSIEAIQLYRKAAADSGVAVGAMDTALRSLARRSADAAAGNAMFAKGFDQLGVEVKNADGSLKSVDQLLPEMAAGMAALGSAGERTSAAMKTMGIGGAAMLPMLQGGTEELKAMTDKARELGGVMSDESALAGERLTQSIGDLSFAVQGLSQGLGSSLIPALTVAAEAYVKLARKSRSAHDSMANGQIQLVGLTQESTAAQIAEIDKQIDAINQGINAAHVDAKTREVLFDTVGALHIQRTKRVKLLAEDEKRAKAAEAREATRLMKEEERNQTRDAETGSRERQAATSKAMHERSKMVIADAREREAHAASIRANNLTEMATFNAAVAKQDEDLAKEKEKFAKQAAGVQIAESKKAAAQQKADAAQTERHVTAAANIMSSSIVAGYDRAQEKGVSATVAAREAAVSMGKSALAAAADYALAEGVKVIAVKITEAAEKSKDASTTASAVTASTIKSGAAISSAGTQISADMAAGTTSTTAAYAGIPFAGPVLAAAAVAVLIGIMLKAKGGMQGFAEGGEVTGGTPGKDSVAALLTPGEVVLSVPQVKGLRKLVGSGGAAPSAQGGTLAFSKGGAVPQQAAQQVAGNIVVHIAPGSSRVAQRKQARQMAMNIRQMQRRGL